MEYFIKIRNETLIALMRHQKRYKSALRERKLYAQKGAIAPTPPQIRTHVAAPDKRTWYVPEP